MQHDLLSDIFHEKLGITLATIIDDKLAVLQPASLRSVSATDRIITAPVTTLIIETLRIGTRWSTEFFWLLAKKCITKKNPGHQHVQCRSNIRTGFFIVCQITKKVSHMTTQPVQWYDPIEGVLGS